MSNWLRFYRKSELHARRLVALESSDIRAQNPLFEEFQKAVCLGDKNESAQFSHALVANVVAKPDQEIHVVEAAYELPMYDAEKQMTFYPEMKCSFIGTAQGVAIAKKEMAVMAETTRPFFEDWNFWAGDLDLKNADYPKRERYLSYHKGIPVGIMCQQSFAFVVSDKQVEKQIVEMLSTVHRTPAPL